MQISLIAAMDNARGIGKNGHMPWHLPADLKHFKAKTIGKPVIMGKKTYLSIGKPLPDRTNIVLTHDSEFKANGCLIAHTLEDALSLAKEAPEVMVIGGGTIYQQTLPLAQTLYLTLIDKTFEADTYFPSWSSDEWHEVSKEAHQTPEFSFYFVELRRKVSHSSLHRRGKVSHEAKR